MLGPSWFVAALGTRVRAAGSNEASASGHRGPAQHKPPASKVHTGNKGKTQ
jgi:hypothetical protein